MMNTTTTEGASMAGTDGKSTNHARWLRGGVVAFVALVCVFSATGCASTPQAGETGVIRNGGPFDNHDIRGCNGKELTDVCGIIPNGAGYTWTGIGSSVHYYPVASQQRYFKMEKCYGKPDCDADAPPVRVQTADGVDVAIEGTFYLNTVFDNSPKGRAAVKSFDTQFATRTFPSSDGDKHAYDGNLGWSAFLGSIVEPIVSNNLRESISGVTCADLVSSCALVQNSATRIDAKKLKAKNNQSNIARVQQQVQQGLAADLASTLGRDFFNPLTLRFALKSVDLPTQVQTAINQAQAAFAQVSQAQARVASARADARANQTREAGYRKCPTCAQIDALKALPKGLQALGSGAVVSVGKTK
jgi:regulator of protease activity HflC (stomatin/prohibitin superfamily)